MASSPASTSGISSRRRSREWLPSLPSLGLLMPRRTRPLKFQCELTVHALRDYPQSGQLFVKWKDGQGNQGFTPTRHVNTTDYSVTWGAPFSFLEGFRVDEETNLPLPRMLHLSIRQVNRHTGAVKRVGILDLNLSELLSAGSAGRQRTFLFLLQESRFNASLSLSLSFKQLGGDPLYRCPIAAKEAETYPSPEELQLARPRSFERERQRRESSGSMGSSSSSSGGSKGSPQGSRSRRREESRDDAKDDKEEGQQRPTSLPQSGSSSFSSSSSVRHGYSRSMGAGVPPLSSSSPTRQGASSSPLRPTKERSQTISYGAHVRESAGLHRIRDSLASSVTGGSLLDDEDNLRRLCLSRSSQRGQYQPPIEGEEKVEEEEKKEAERKSEKT